jgi:hypothetical protein
MYHKNIFMQAKEEVWVPYVGGFSVKQGVGVGCKKGVLTGVTLHIIRGIF